MKEEGKMKQWMVQFWKKHGERLIFMILAGTMAIIFWFMPDLKESGKTILIGLAMLCYNKARSGEEAKEEVRG